MCSIAEGPRATSCRRKLTETLSSRIRSARVDFDCRSCAVRVAIFTIPPPFEYVPRCRPIDDESIDDEAPPRSTPLHHVEVVYKAEVTRSRTTFYALFDSEVAGAPYPIDFAALTRFVETND